VKESAAVRQRQECRSLAYWLATVCVFRQGSIQRWIEITDHRIDCSRRCETHRKADKEICYNSVRLRTSPSGGVFLVPDRKPLPLALNLKDPEASSCCSEASVKQLAEMPGWSRGGSQGSNTHSLGQISLFFHLISGSVCFTLCSPAAVALTFHTG